MITDSLYTTYLQNLLDGEKAACKRIVATVLDTDIEVKELYERLFQRSLYRIGELWEFNKISVAVEHLATSITESVLHQVYPRIFAADHHGRKAIISCVANEYHQLGAKMVADMFELNGWDGYFLGANTPLDDLLQLIDEKKPEFLGLSLSIYFNTARLIDVINEVRGAYPQLDILVGGQAFRWGGTDIVNASSRLHYIASLHQLDTMLKEAGTHA